MDDKKIPFILKHFFKDVKIEDGNKTNVSAVCRKCSKTLKGSFSATTNFLKHIKRKGHNDMLKKYEELKPVPVQKRKSTVIDSDTESTPKKMKQTTLSTTLPTDISNSIDFDQLVVNFIVDTMSPMSIVENHSFKALIEGTQQLLNPPKIMCSCTCNIKISEQYMKFKDNTKIELKSVDFICTTADIWSSSKRTYLRVTAHWIDRNTFERKSATLACRRFKCSHTFDRVAELIADIHEEFDLKLSKIVKTITDNGPNMIKAFETYGEPELADIKNIEVDVDDCDDDDDENEDEDDEDDVLYQRELFKSSEDHEEYNFPNHERCATHTLHLIASKDIDKARSQSNVYKKIHDAAMGKCQALWNLCSRSPKACETYIHFTGTSPTTPCPTRWNSSYDCIRDLLAVEENLNETLRQLGLASFKEIEIQFLNEYTTCTKPIAEGIKSLEEDKDAFYGCLLPELMRMQRLLNSFNMDNPKYCGVLIDVIKESLIKRFKTFYELEEPKAKDSILASVSYPFFKLKWVPHANREYVKELLLSEVRKIKQQDMKTICDTTDKKKEKNESYYMFVEDSDSSAASDHANTSMDLETVQYLKDSDTSLDSLNKYPYVKKIFLKYNTCLSSAAPVQRLFSSGGMLMRPNSQKIKDKLFEQIVVLKSMT